MEKIPITQTEVMIVKYTPNDIKCQCCGSQFKGTALTKYCPTCREEIYGEASNLSIGSTAECAKCKKKFTRWSPAQLYCHKCAEKIHNKQHVKASAKYNSSNYDRLELRVPKGQKANIVAHAQMNNESLNQFLTRAVDNQIEQDVQLQFQDKTGSDQD